MDSGLPGLGTRPHEPGFGAPEQQAQGEVSPASDIYSLGATLYALLTNQTPANALSRESGLADLVPAREVNPDIEPYLSLVAARAMSLRPDSRYESAADFAQALNRPAGHRAAPAGPPRRVPEQAAPAAPPPRLPASRRRQMERRTIYGLLGLLLFVIALGTAFGALNMGGPAEISEAEATATLESAVVAALTAIAPTATPVPEPTTPPTPTPQPFITTTGSRMLFVPEGIFRMGDDESDQRDQQPSHLIRLDAYYIDETEVTNAAYAQCVDDDVCAPPDSPNATYHGSYYGNAAFDDYPVIFVSWFDADVFCTWRDGRLPSEAEWEKAAGFEPVRECAHALPVGRRISGHALKLLRQKLPARLQ